MQRGWGSIWDHLKFQWKFREPKITEDQEAKAEEPELRAKSQSQSQEPEPRAKSQSQS